MTRQSMLMRTWGLLFVVSVLFFLSSVHRISCIESVVLKSLTCSFTCTSPFLWLNYQPHIVQVSRGSGSSIFKGTSSKNDRGLAGHQGDTHSLCRTELLTNSCHSPALSYCPWQIIWLSSYRLLLMVKSCKLFTHDVDHFKILKILNTSALKLQSLPESPNLPRIPRQLSHFPGFPMFATEGVDSSFLYTDSVIVPRNSPGSLGGLLIITPVHPNCPQSPPHSLPLWTSNK